MTFTDIVFVTFNIMCLTISFLVVQHNIQQFRHLFSIVQVLQVSRQYILWVIFFFCYYYFAFTFNNCNNNLFMLYFVFFVDLLLYNLTYHTIIFSSYYENKYWKSHCPSLFLLPINLIRDIFWSNSIGPVF